MSVGPGCLPFLPDEARETVALYLDGKIDQWHSLQDRRGVAFILNVTDLAAAHGMLENLPLRQFNPPRQLQGMTPKP